MKVPRIIFDGAYDYLVKPIVFGVNTKDPEKAHHFFFGSLKMMDALGLAGFALNNPANKMNPGYDISNAAGFYKNAEINPRLMKMLGFDRVVVGTVTGDPWKGNDRPRIKRFVETGSLVNWMGLPGVGADEVARRLKKYGDHGVPLTVNLMATPGKKGQDKLDDLRYTVLALKDNPYVNSFELNISCPNTHGSDGSRDARADNLADLEAMLATVRGSMRSLGQTLYVKVSPDSTEADVDDTVTVGENYGVDGYVTGNTTTRHNKIYIPEDMGTCGASGNAVWEPSKEVQGYYAARLVNSDARLIACGGINSVERAKERLKTRNCKEIQIFTGLVFNGTKFLRELRAA